MRARVTLLITILVLLGSNSLINVDRPIGVRDKAKFVADKLPQTTGEPIAVPFRTDAVLDPTVQFSHACGNPDECLAKFKRTIEKYTELSDYHDKMHLRYAIPHTDEVGDETVYEATPRSTWHMKLAVKYYRAAAHPWLPVEPDPPEPKL